MWREAALGLIGGLCLALVGCSAPAESSSPPVPVLIEEATLPAPTVTPLVLALPSPLAPQAVQNISPTPSPVEVGSAFRLKTATPPPRPSPTATDTPTLTPVPSATRTATPSRTPTLTPSITPTLRPSPTLTPSPNLTASRTPSASPTEVCPRAWFFAPPPPTCPDSAPQTSQAAYQQMEGGWLIWLAEGGRIYALFTDGRTPAWLSAFDTYVEGEMISVEQSPPLGAFVPQRGFGKLWRDNPQIRERLGWALSPEYSYSAQSQSDAQTLYLSGLQGEIYALQRDGSTWMRR